MTKLELQEKVNELLQELDMCSEIAKRCNQDFYCFLNRDLDKDIAKLNVELSKIPELNELWLKTKELRAKPLDEADFVLLDYIFDDHTYNEDEYCKCDNCQVIFADPHWDYNYYKEGVYMVDCFEDYVPICAHCATTELKEDYIDYIKNNPKRVVQLLSKTDMEQDGWETITPECENGMYGINHDPQCIYQEQRKTYSEDLYDLIFVRTDENMYMINFVLMAKKKGE